VLRLARDAGSNSTDDRWQVLSLLDNGTLCTFVQRRRNGKGKKVTGRKRKIAVAISKSRNAVTQSAKRRGRQKPKIKKNATSVTTVLNKHCEQTDVPPADCRDFSGSSSAQKRRTVTRRSRTVTHSDETHAQKENFIKANDCGNMIETNDIPNNVDDAGSVVPPNHFEMTMDSESLLLQKQGIDQDMDNCQKGSRLNGTFRVRNESLKTGQRRKVTTKLEASKHPCGVEASEAEAEGVKTEIEAGETVDVASVSEPSTLNSDVIFCGISKSRRSRPVKNRRLMDSCFVYDQTVRRSRPRKTAKTQPASEAVINLECMVTGPSEINSDQLQSICDANNHATVTDDRLNCPTSMNEETSCTLHKSDVLTTECEKCDSPSDLHALCPLNDISEDASGFGVDGNACTPKPNPDLSFCDSESTQSLLEQDYTNVTKVEENHWMVTDDSKFATSCDESANKDMLPAESNSPLLNSMHSYVKDGSVDIWQLPIASENSCQRFDHLGMNDDSLLVTWPSEPPLIEPVEPIMSSAINTDSCTADSSRTEMIQSTDSEMYNVSTHSSDALPDLGENALGIVDDMLGANASKTEAGVFTTASEFDSCKRFDHLGKTDDPRLATWPAEPPEIEPVGPILSIAINNDLSTAGSSTTVTQPTDIEIHDASTNNSDGFGSMPDLTEDTESNVDSHIFAAESADASKTEANVFTVASELDSCKGFDYLNQTDDSLLATWPAEPPEIEPVEPILSIRINNDFSTADNGTTEIQPTDGEMYNASTNSSDGLSSMPDLNENTAGNVGAYASKIEVDVFTMASESDSCNVVKTATWPAETPEIESILGSTVNESCTADTSTTEMIQLTDGEMYDAFTNYSDALSCMPPLDENTASYMDVGFGAEVDISTMAAEFDCMPSQNAGDTKLYMDVLNDLMDSASVIVNLAPVEAEVFVTADAVTSKLSNDVGDGDNVLFPCESENLAKLNNISVAAPSLSGSVDRDECHNVCCDEIITTNIDREIVNPSCPQAFSSATESKLSVKRAVTRRRRRNNTHRNHRARRNTVSESESAGMETSAESLNVTVCSEENCEELLLGAHNVETRIMIADNQIMDENIDLLDASTITFPESSLPAKRTVSSRCRRYSDRIHRTRQKTVTAGMDFHHNLAENSAESLNATACSDKNRDDLPVGDHNVNKIQIMDQSIDLPDASTNTSSELSSPSKRTVSSRSRRNTRRSHRTRLKTGSENVCSENHEGLPVGDHNLNSDVVNATGSENHVGDRSIDLPDVSTITFPESSLPAKRTVSSRCRRNSDRIHGTRQKTVTSGMDFHHNLSENSAESLNATACSDKNRDELPVGDHNVDADVIVDKIQIMDQNIDLPDASTNTSSESSSLSKRTVSSRSGRNTRRSHRTRLKMGSENICSENREELPVGDHFNLNSDVVNAMGSEYHVGDRSIDLPDVSTNTSAESSLLAKRTASSRCHERHSHRSHRTRLKMDSENVLGEVCQVSAKRCADGTLSSEEKREVMMTTEDIDRLRLKSVDSDKVEEMQISHVETDSLRPRKKHHSESSRLLHCLIVLVI